MKATTPLAGRDVFVYAPIGLFISLSKSGALVIRRRLPRPRIIGHSCRVAYAIIFGRRSLDSIYLVRILLGFTGLHRVLSSIIEFYRIILGFTGFSQWNLLIRQVFTECNWVFLWLTDLLDPPIKNRVG